MLDLKGKPARDISLALLKAGFFPLQQGGVYTLFDKGNLALAQEIIDKFEPIMPTLNPRQFSLLLGYTGLQAGIAPLLSYLEGTDHDLYLQCKSQLEKASFFEWGKALTLYTQLKHIMVLTNPAFDLSEDTLRQKWLEMYEM